MKKTILSVGLAVGCAFSAAATDYLQNDDFLITNAVVIPGTNATFIATGVATNGFGLTNLVFSGTYSQVGGRYGALPFYNPLEKPYEVFELIGYFTTQTTASTALTNGLMTVNPNSLANNIIGDLAPVDDLTGNWGGPLGFNNAVEGATNASIVFAAADTTNIQAVFAYAPTTNFQNIIKEGLVDLRCAGSNNFFVLRCRLLGNVQKSP